jgi:hypothetical protein
MYAFSLKNESPGTTDIPITNDTNKIKAKENN